MKASYIKKERINNNIFHIFYYEKQTSSLTNHHTKSVYMIAGIVPLCSAFFHSDYGNNSIHYILGPIEDTNIEYLSSSGDVFSLSMQKDWRISCGPAEATGLSANIKIEKQVNVLDKKIREILTEIQSVLLFENLYGIDIENQIFCTPPLNKHQRIKAHINLRANIYIKHENKDDIQKIINYLNTSIISLPLVDKNKNSKFNIHVRRDENSENL